MKMTDHQKSPVTGLSFIPKYKKGEYHENNNDKHG